MKKLVSMLLVVSMLFLSTVQVYAHQEVFESIDSDAALELKIQSEIAKMEEMVWEDLYNQLAAQNALDGLEFFKEALRPDIERIVYEKYNVLPISNMAEPRGTTYIYNFPNGGLVAYTGSLNTEQVVLCMNPQDTLEYVFDSSATVGDMIISVLTFLPGTNLIGLAATAKLALTVTAKNEIKAAGYYSKVITISWGSGAEYGSYAYGWDTHPTCTISDAVSGIRYLQYGV